MPRGERGRFATRTATAHVAQCERCAQRHSATAQRRCRRRRAQRQHDVDSTLPLVADRSISFTSTTPRATLSNAFARVQSKSRLEMRSRLKFSVLLHNDSDARAAVAHCGALSERLALVLGDLFADNAAVMLGEFVFPLYYTARTVAAVSAVPRADRRWCDSASPPRKATSAATRLVGSPRRLSASLSPILHRLPFSRCSSLTI
jgi:hypothetical protein